MHNHRGHNIENKTIISKVQAEFRKNHRTSDYIYTNFLALQGNILRMVNTFAPGSWTSKRNTIPFGKND